MKTATLVSERQDVLLHSLEKKIFPSNFGPLIGVRDVSRDVNQPSPTRL